MWGVAGRSGRHSGQAPPPSTTPRRLDEADVADLVAALAYALRYDARGKPRKCGWDHAADLAAEWLAEHLRRLDLIASGAAPPRCTGPGENGLSGCQHGGMVAVMAVSLSPNSAPARTSHSSTALRIPRNW
ncbi:hypothetical protein GCM10011504_51740 [Siccirubricoccus deserti]|nr:hypothetical protein GCM10011504_51740 [Siccirubricoccus deserti]